MRGALVSFFLPNFSPFADTSVDGLEQTMNSGTDTILIVQNIITEAVDLMDTLVQDLHALAGDLSLLLTTINGICPKKRSQLCDNLLDPDSCDTAGVFATSIFQQIITRLNDIDGESDPLLPRLINTRNGLQDMLEVTDNVSDQVDTLDWILSVAMFFALCLSLLTLAMIATLVYPKGRLVQCIQHRFVMPLFIFLVTLSFLFAISFIIASLALSDTCVDDPDPRFKAVADNYFFDKSSHVYQFVELYLSRKHQDTPIDYLNILPNFLHSPQSLPRL